MKKATIKIFFTDRTEEKITLSQVRGVYHNSEKLIVSTLEKELCFSNVESFYIITE